jgi:putative thioredoxin
MEQLIGGGVTGPDGADAGLIKDTDTQNFSADVLEASREVPVIVDFWAPWCGPCKQLGPLLERLVQEARGKVKLVKLNVDQNQALAGQFRIQSIPAVYAFFDGQPVDGFVGAQPESELRQFIERLAATAAAAHGPSPVDEAVAAATKALEDGDPGTAAQIYAKVLEHEADNIVAMSGLIRCVVQLGDLDQARQLLAQVPEEAAKNPAMQAARTAVELAEQAAGAGDLGELEDAIAHNPDNHQARYDLAMALYAGGHAEAAMDHLLTIFRRDRAWNDEEARKQLLKMFEALGPTHALTIQGRRKLSSMLFS